VEQIRSRVQDWWRDLGEPWRTVCIVLFAVLIFIVYAIRV
jgi:hypothetical protein